MTTGWRWFWFLLQSAAVGTGLAAGIRIFEAATS